ncbi:MAG: serine/threonine protein kinase [Cyanobacteria bacterium SZAS-4]|nr:serine/threonine protein kinase [Cyanobacteria bacterium SZAS-4]
MTIDALNDPQQNRSKATLLPHTMIAEKYKVLSHIGSGGMGAVYVVQQIFLDKEFALKLLAGGDHSDVDTRRFQQEARTTARLRHPNLISVHDFGVYENDQPFLVMDLVRGYTLARLLKTSGTLSIDYTMALALEVSQGLKYAHDQGVVHRDIKPSNIMLLFADEKPAKGTIKILDFGIAKLMQSEDGEVQHLTKTGEIFGSPIYMSPEQCQGLAVDRRADIYSLGCVIFECLAGSPPFLGDNAMSTMLKRVTDKPASLKEASLGKEFPPGLEAIVHKMLEVNPDDRYQNFDAVIKDLLQLDRDTHVSPVRDIAKPKKNTWLPILKDLSIVAVTAILSCAAMALLDRQVIFREEFSTGNAERAERKRQAELADMQSAQHVFIDYKEVSKYPTRTTTGDGREMLHFPNKIGDIKVGVGADKRWRTASGDIQTDGQPVSLALDEEAGADPQILKYLLDVNFEQISYPGKYRLTNDTLEAIGQLKHLRCLDVDGGDISSLLPLYDTKLDALDVGETRLQSTEILKLKHLRELESLTVGPVDKPALVLSELAKGTKLRALHYKGALPTENEAKLWQELNSFDINIIVQIPNLEYLLLQNCPEVDDACIKKLLSAKKLRQLVLKDCNAITPKSIPILKQMGLKKLSITATNWSESDQAQLRKIAAQVTISPLRQQKNDDSQKKIFDVAKTFDLNDPALPP